MAEHFFEVLFDFSAEEEGELSIYQGEKVSATTNADEDGWLCVTSDDGSTGFVPIEYLKPSETGFDHPASAPDVEEDASEAPAAAPEPAPSSAQAYINNTPKPPTPPSVRVAEPSSAASNASSNSRLTADMLAAEPESAPARAAQSVPTQQPKAQTAPQAESIFSPLGAKASTGPASVSSASRVSMGSKFSLKSAAKSVANVNRAVAQLSTKTIPPAKPPTLMLSVERDNLDELLKKNSEYFTRVVASQGETLDSVTEMVDVLTKKLADASQSSNDFVSRLNELDEMIDEEKRKWKMQMETERNSGLNERSSEILGKSTAGLSASQASTSFR
jgi:hypothetical protein